MKDEMKVQVFNEGELIKEVNEPNVVIISERSRGLLFNKFNGVSALVIMAHLSSAYDDMLTIMKEKYGMNEKDVSDSVKRLKIDIASTVSGKL